MMFLLPSVFQISVSESFTKLKPYTGVDQDHVLTLKNFPTRDHDDYYTLGDILCNSHNLNGSNVNILACVKEVISVLVFDPKQRSGSVKVECSPPERKVVSSSHGRVIPKT